MKLIYKEKPLLEKIELAIAKAKTKNRQLKRIILTPMEFKELQTRWGIGYGHDTYINGVSIEQEA